MSEPADSDKRFEQVLASFLREDLGPSRRNCPHPGLLSACFEGKLAEPEARELEVHVSGCGSCQAELAALVRLQAEPATEGGPAEPVAAPPAITIPGEPSPEAERTLSPAQPAVEAMPFREDLLRVLRRKPARRRTLWVWVAPVALAASAVLAISVTYRFAPLIDQVSRRSREPGMGTLEPQNASPLAAKRDEGTSAKEASQTAPAAPPTAASPAAPPMFDEMRGAESVSPQSESQPRQKAGASSGAPSGAELQTNAAPTAPGPPAVSAPLAEPNAVAEAKPAQQLEPRREDRAAPLAAVPANQEGAAPLAKAAEPAADRAVVIVARTDPRFAWRIRDASIERSNDAGKTWRAQSTGGATGMLTGSAPTATICWLAGRSGLVLRTTDGEHWLRLAPPTTSDLADIQARDASNATVQTAGGERFSTRDGGQSWSKL